MSSLIVCTYCGAQNLESIEICRSCEHSVSELPPTISLKIKAKFDRQPTRLEVVVFAQFVAILLLALWSWNISHSEPSPDTSYVDFGSSNAAKIDGLLGREADRERFRLQDELNSFD
jgi:hypothetical protein